MMYLAGFLTFATFPFWKDLAGSTQCLGFGILLLVPGGVDGTTQMFLYRESTNTLRVITGFLIGVGIPLIVWAVIMILTTEL